MLDYGTSGCMLTMWSLDQLCRLWPQSKNMPTLSSIGEGFRSHIHLILLPMKFIILAFFLLFTLDLWVFCWFLIMASYIHMIDDLEDIVAEELSNSSCLRKRFLNEAFNALHLRTFEYHLHECTFPEKLFKIMFTHYSQFSDAINHSCDWWHRRIVSTMNSTFPIMNYIMLYASAHLKNKELNIFTRII